METKYHRSEDQWTWSKALLPLVFMEAAGQPFARWRLAVPRFELDRAD